MRREPIFKSKSLGTSTDLTFYAPIRKGFVDSMDSLTYKARIYQTLRVLNQGRSNSHEYLLIRPISDAVERTGKIISVRVLILDEHVLLSVTFDGDWASYLRVLWQKVARLLDLIFCSTEGFVSALDHSYEDWARWVDSIQYETNFFYGPPNLTPHDIQYLQRQESLGRRRIPQPEVDLAAARLHHYSPEDQALEFALEARGTSIVRHYTEVGRIGTQTMVGLYGLSNLYPPGSRDGAYLLSAAQILLLEFVHIMRNVTEFGTFIDVKKDIDSRYQQELDWLLSAAPYDFSDPLKTQRKRPKPNPLPDQGPVISPELRQNTQAGLLEPIRDRHLGALLIVEFDNAKAAAEFLDQMCSRVNNAMPPAISSIVTTLALTYEGIKVAGLSDEQLELFPLEFRQGMAGRAGVLGDLMVNHPKRWRLPTRLRRGQLPLIQDSTDNVMSIKLSQVHAIVQLRAPGRSTERANAQDLAQQFEQVFREPIQEISQLAAGAQVIAIEPMHRLFNQEKTIEHFGYFDGDQSDPTFEPLKKADQDNPQGDYKHYRNQAHLGDLLWGYPNASDPEQMPVDSNQERTELLKGGSFMALRKLKQDVALFEKRISDVLPFAPPGTTADLIRAKMMGRRSDGSSILKNASDYSNDFDYSADRYGRGCPFHAHIRRTNPREDFTLTPVDQSPTGSAKWVTVDGQAIERSTKGHPLAVPHLEGGRAPRLFRRGMSYGPRFDATKADDGHDRGMMFIAQVANLSEQFETVQQWISGSNSTGGYSGQGDPFMAVPPRGEQHVFRFEAQLRDGRDPAVVRVPLNGLNDREGDQISAVRDVPMLVRLEWGAYGFVPSISALRKIQQISRKVSEKAQCPWHAAQLQKKGAESIQAAGADVQAWKVLLEDPESVRLFTHAAVLSQIRDKGGIHQLNSACFVVAKHDLINQVLSNDQVFSVEGYRDRMNKSFGKIFLGVDSHDGPGEYQQLAGNVIPALRALTFVDGFIPSFRGVFKGIDREVLREKSSQSQRVDGSWEHQYTANDLINHCLQEVSSHWFGIRSPFAAPPGHEELIKPDKARFDSDPQGSGRVPGDFTPPSRYFFQPWPNDTAQDYGQKYGKLLFDRFQQWLFPEGAAVCPPAHPARNSVLGKPIVQAFEADPENLPRSMIGALMGYLPTVAGNLSLVMQEWLIQGEFWKLRGRVLDELGPTGAQQLLAIANGPPEGIASIEPVIARLKDILLAEIDSAMQVRATPELLWRTAIQDTTLNGQAIPKGAVIVLSLTSAHHELFETGQASPYVSFGGLREHDMPRSGVPTHACPAYIAAKGMLVGAFAALLARTELLRQETAGSVILYGPFNPLEKPEPEPIEPPLLKEVVLALKGLPANLAAPIVYLKKALAPTAVSLVTNLHRIDEYLLNRGLFFRPFSLLTQQRYRRGKVQIWPLVKPTVTRLLPAQFLSAQGKDSIIAYGDSWLESYGFRVAGYSDLGRALVTALKDNHGKKASIVRVVDLPSTDQPVKFNDPGYTLQYVSSVSLLAKLKEYLEGIDVKDRPRTILLSAGGNDVRSDELLSHLFPASDRPTDRLLMPSFDRKIADMRSQYISILEQLKVFADNDPKTSIHVYLHGYGNPIVDGQYTTALSSNSWLWEPFAKRGYLSAFENGSAQLPSPYLPSEGSDWTPAQREQIELACRIMQQVIGQFNDMLAELAPKYSFLTYLDVRPLFTPPTSGSYIPANYRQEWLNELHPTESQYLKIAAEIAKKIVERKLK